MQDDVVIDFTDEAPERSRRSFGLSSILLIVGIVLAMTVFGIALAQRNLSQPTSGPAPDFTMTTFDGSPFRLSDQRGKVVIVNFWASWCIPCRDEAPILQSLWERYRDQGVVLVGVAYLDSDQGSRAFIVEFGITYPNGPDLRTEISQAYRIQGVPETFVVDQNGDIVHFIIAPVQPGQLDAIVAELLARDR
ncbi:MAG: TlpA family protein disulfide reductase [Anaerolineae bacterium]|nr:TlpA family protein disulfide reductase [Anaerolineae bacterium]